MSVFSNVNSNALKMALLVTGVVSIGGLVEIVPLFFIRDTVPPVAGVKPYGALALEGRDKITFLVSRSVALLPAWVEQLVAESTGGRRNRIDTILVCRVPEEEAEPTEAEEPQAHGATASGATASGARVEEPAGAVEG